MVRYQCLRCRAAADESGCPACGAPPDPLGVELGRLAEARHALDQREHVLRHEFADVQRRRHDLDRRAGQVWAEITRRGPLAADPARTDPTQAGAARSGEAARPAAPQAVRPQPRPAHPQPQRARQQPAAHGAAAAVPAARPETSSRSVQNILLVLGGLLLGVAAVVFTAVAWANFGLGGRAAILGVTTLVALAVPVTLRRRELVATAETIGALALLLVLLDGYAAWAVNLFGAQRLTPPGYAALVFAATAAVAAGYTAPSRLVGPRFVALLAAQPVLPLLAAAWEASLLGHATAFAAVCAADLAVLLALRGRRRTPASTPDPAALTGADAARARVGVAQAVAAGVLAALNALLATLLALVELVAADTAVDAVLAGAVLAVIATLALTTATISRVNSAIAVASGVAVVVVVVAVARPIALAAPGHGLLAAAVVTALTWAVATPLPGPFRTGALVASWATAAVVALPAAATAVGNGLRVLFATIPVWHTDLDRWREVVTSSGWRPMAVLAVLAVAGLTLPRLRTAAAPSRAEQRVTGIGQHAAVVATGLIGFGATAALPLPWWSPSLIGGGLGAALIASGVWGGAPGADARDGGPSPARNDGPAGAGGGRSAGGAHSAEAAGVVRALVGASLVLYGVGASLVRPGATALTLGAVAVAAALVAGLAVVTGARHGRVIGGASVATGLAVLSGALGATGVAFAWPEAATIPAMTAAAGVALLLAALLRQVGGGWSAYLPHAVAGVAVTTAVSTFAALGSAQPAGPYAAAAVLIGVGNGVLLTRARGARIALSCAVPGLVAVTSAAPAAFAPAQAYLWIFTPWRGEGESTRDLLWQRAVTPADGWDVLTLLILTGAGAAGALGVAGARWTPVAALPGVVVTALAAPVAFDLPWPALPAAALAIAATSGLAGAVAPRRSSRPTLALTRSSWFIWPVTGSLGLANCLATSTATLVGLTVATAAALVTALLGRTVAARVTGWVVAAAAAALFAHAAGLVAELGREVRPYGVLGVAALLLLAAAVLPDRARAAEARATEILSAAVAGFAIISGFPELTTMAVSFAGYGALLGLSALRPGRIRLAIGGAACELAAWWLFLAGQGVELVEAYTLPFAAAALAGGLIELRRRPDLDSWRGYGVALAAAFLPSLALILQDDAAPARRLALGAAALAVVVAGAARRRQAPVVIGGAVLAIAALRELAALWELLPRWLPLAVAGLLLVALGATYEQRRRDLRRLREAVGRMR